MTLPSLQFTGCCRVLRLVTLLAGTVTFEAVAEDTVDFDRDIRPILSDNCFQCHGPDEETRAADLRLDRKDSAFASVDGRHRIVPGDPEASELYRRVTSADSDARMPPHDSDRTLTPQQIRQIGQWIEQGARWQEHWSFVAPVRPQKPDLGDHEWIRNPIDLFVLDRLLEFGLQPSPVADHNTLIRRVTLDLTGLPPTPEEVDAFLKDPSPDAWETVVDRLLGSTAYGEHMAVRWLDLARYADTSGYQNDGPRDMWRWRDWVINAYNSNMPFDQFTIEQLAGDMLQPLPAPGRTGRGGLKLDEQSLNRWIASAFNRNHRGNSEGGVDPDEYQVEYVVDRVDTTATVWLGLTMGCARCHDHKYDPISQREFYQVYSCFNNIAENGRAIKQGNSPPFIKAPTPSQRRRLNELEVESDVLQKLWDQSQPTRSEKQSDWEATLPNDTSVDWSPAEGLTARLPLDGSLVNSVAGTKAAAAEAPEDVAELSFVSGRLGQAVQLTNNNSISAGDIAAFDFMDSFSLSAWVSTESDGTVLARRKPEPDGQGYSIVIENGKIHVNLINRWLDDCIRLSTIESVPQDEWHHLTMTYDGSRQAAGVAVYLDGRLCDVDVHFDFLNQSFASTEPLLIGSGITPLRGMIDEVRVYDCVLAPPEVSVLATADTVSELAQKPANQRTQAQAEKLSAAFIALAAPDDLRDLAQRRDDNEHRKEQFIAEIPTAMVMYESMPRTTRILRRGQFDQPTDEVQSAVPAVLASEETALKDGRLGLARWLVSGQHPLTARVAVNRYWQTYFGEGLVRTPEDFGSQGHRPSHPKLLDWLATEFVLNDWDVRHIQKLIVMSATYRQSSATSDTLRARDPDNMLLARGPRFRLSAEVVRDQALAASGLLSRTVGGPSVKTYQPEGLWSEVATDKVYEPATGNDLYRRSLYTYWKRTIGPPTMMTFDATTREMCTVRRARTNTPLQALALMNDVTYVEAARALAQRIIRDGGTSPDSKLVHGYQLLLSRSPDEEELTVLRAAVEKYSAAFENNPASAGQLTSIGEAPVAEDANITELATWTALVSVILNLDETVTRR